MYCACSVGLDPVGELSMTGQKSQSSMRGQPSVAHMCTGSWFLYVKFWVALYIINDHHCMCEMYVWTNVYVKMTMLLTCMHILRLRGWTPNNMAYFQTMTCDWPNALQLQTVCQVPACQCSGWLFLTVGPLCQAIKVTGQVHSSWGKLKKRYQKVTGCKHLEDWIQCSMLTSFKNEDQHKTYIK